MIDTNILQSVDIDPSILFVYDDIAFPYIVLWYSTLQHKTMYQVFYNSTMAIEFYDILANRGKSVVIYGWRTDDRRYISIQP